MVSFVLRSLLVVFLASVSLLCNAYSAGQGLTLKASKERIVVGIPNGSTVVEGTKKIEIERLNSFLRWYWMDWGATYGYDVVLEEGAFFDLTRSLRLEEVDVVAFGLFQYQNPSPFIYSIPYIYSDIKMLERVGERLPSNNVSFDFKDLPVTEYFNNRFSITPFDLNQVERANHVFSWNSQPEYTSEIQDAMGQFSQSAIFPQSLLLRAFTRADNTTLLIDINKGIRSVDHSRILEAWNQTFDGKATLFGTQAGLYLDDLSDKHEELIARKPVMRYAFIEAGEEPFFLTDEPMLQGMNIDLLKALTQRIGVSFIGKSYPSFQEAMVGVRVGEVDIFPGVYRTKERQLNMLFTQPTGETSLSIASEEDYYSLEQLKGLKLALVRGMFENDIVLDELQGNPVIFVDTTEQALKMVASGRAQAHVGKLQVLLYQINEHQLYSLQLHRVEDRVRDLSTRIAINSENEGFQSLLNLGIFSLGKRYFEELRASWQVYTQQSQEAQRVQNLNEKIALFMAAFLLIGLLLLLLYQRQMKRKFELLSTTKEALKDAQVAREEAEMMTRAKSDFLARMTHEIRTPMNGVLGMAEALSYSKLNREQQDLLDTLNVSANNLMALLNDVLDFSKFDAGKLALDPVESNLKSVVEMVANNFKHKASSKGLSIEFSSDSNIAHTYLCDSTRLLQVLNNLVSNAVKFTSEGTVSIFLTLETAFSTRETDRLSFEVRDSGIGIKQEKIDTLFTPFVQAEGDINRRFGGTGLGLSICKEIVEAMNGTIVVDSVIGHGSMFTVTVELKKGALIDEEAVVSSVVSAGVVNDVSKLKVLLVEDNPINQKVVGGQLHRLNVNYGVADHGLHALELYDDTYDVILSDCHMPHMNGFELAKEISGARKTEKPYLIAITADSQKSSHDKCLKAGFDDWVTKPCPIDVLEQSLSKAVIVLDTLGVAESLNDSGDYYFDNPSWFDGEELALELEQEFSDDATLFSEFSLDDSVKAFTSGGDLNELNGDFEVPELEWSGEAACVAGNIDDDSFDFDRVLDVTGGDRNSAIAVIEQYLLHYEQEIGSLVKSQKNASVDALSSTAHRIKGTFLCLGCSRLSESAIVLEQNAEQLTYEQRELLISELAEGAQKIALECEQRIQMEIADEPR